MCGPRGRPAPSSRTTRRGRSPPVQTRPQRGLAPGAIASWRSRRAALCAGAVVLTLAEAPAGDRAWAAVTGALVIAAPVGVGLATLARRQDRFAALLVRGLLWSVTVLAESHDATLYSVGRIAAWIVDLVVVYLLLSFPSGRLTSSPARGDGGGRRSSACSTSPPRSSCSTTPSPRRGRRAASTARPTPSRSGHTTPAFVATWSARCARCCGAGLPRRRRHPGPAHVPGRAAAAPDARAGARHGHVPRRRARGLRRGSRLEPRVGERRRLGWIYVLRSGSSH